MELPLKMATTKAQSRGVKEPVIMRAAKSYGPIAP